MSAFKNCLVSGVEARALISGSSDMEVIPQALPLHPGAPGVSKTRLHILRGARWLPAVGPLPPGLVGLESLHKTAPSCSCSALSRFCY